MPDEFSLHALPLAERRDAVESFVLDQFKAALLMESDDDLPLESGFFELGLTSLSLIELRRTLERRLGLQIDTRVLFNQPTIAQLADYLMRELDAPERSDAERRDAEVAR
ncbi:MULTISPECIES: acyl carrier protein [unclassified Solwaraspora]|mgnify:CR=1 FL=1|uniref:acyl carrier protein n=1 Tax=unclassified Solwaraspora TaxID=2627926 RepID=UPI00248B06C3|nr:MULTISPECIES: acyl carrier protein [unclassified Solwaraspora]WBB95639.1 acyl carrier protein [Solwaraspora sp. WMMA2059]WBC20457.1 acyl carrier protein [Solwaraspora sp. WMMA2080]WJK37390.1 acyl carrier protein [Solwaraspora sp. WMMA2065]